MTESHTIHPRPCDNGPEWHVSQCACGQLTLQLGRMRIEFTRGEFAQLHRLIQEAMTQFRIAPSERGVHRPRGTTH